MLRLDRIAQIDSPEYRLNPFPRPVWFPDHIPSLANNDEQESTGDRDDWSGSWTNEIFVIEWVDAEKVKEILLREFPKLRAVNVAWGNEVIVTGPYSKMRTVEALIKYLDDKRWYTPPGNGDEQ